MRLLPFMVHNATSVYEIQLPSTVDNFRQHHHNTSFIAFSMNDLKIGFCGYFGITLLQHSRFA